MHGHVPPPLPGAGSSGLGVSLLFLQTVRTTERIYQRFGSLEEAMEAVLQIFEAHLEARIRQDEQWAPPSFRALMPDARPSRTATYKLADVCHFLDKFGDIFIMVLEAGGGPSSGGYRPLDREAVKRGIQEYLSRKVGL